MDSGADDLVVGQASQPADSLGKEGRELAGIDSVGLFPRFAQSGGFRIESKPALGRLKLKNLNAPHLQGLYRDRLDSGLSGSTVQKIHHVLHKGLRQAVMWNLIPRNPADSVKVPTPTPKEMHPLSAEQARILLEAARGDRLEALYVLALHTGMRRGELLALKWTDVDLDNTTVRVRRTLTRGQDGRGYIVGAATKSGKGRHVRLTPRAVEALKRHRARQAKVRLLKA